MTTTRPQHRQHQLLLAIVLFLVGQLALALHSHDLSLYSADTEECVVCLVTTSDDPVAVTETAHFVFPVENKQHLPAFGLTLTQRQQAPSQPRAPPRS